MGANVSNDIIIKDVEFNGALLKAAQDADDIIWVGVIWVCQGLGLSEGQTKNERKKIQTDRVLSQGGRNFVLPTSGGNQEVLCLQLDFLPLWLAKIHITPRMNIANPKLADNLEEYQLKAKDVLAEAFLKDKMVPLNNLVRLESKLDKMYADMSKLANIVLDLKSCFKDNNLYIGSNITTQGGKNNSSSNDVDSIDYISEWRKSIYKIMDTVWQCENKFQCRNDVLSYLYRYINKNYGIVWDQEIREFKEENKNCKTPHTIDIVENNPMIKSIFEAVLADLQFKCYNHDRNKAENDSDDDTKSDVEKSENNSVRNKKAVTLDDIIHPLIVKQNDHSAYGMYSYRLVYKRMNITERSFKNLSTRYMKKFGKKPSMKELISSNKKLTSMFKSIVNELVSEDN